MLRRYARYAHIFGARAPQTHSHAQSQRSQATILYPFQLLREIEYLQTLTEADDLIMLNSMHWQLQ